MRNDFNPWDSIRQGQQAEQGLAQAEQEGLSWRERLALKRAAGQLGSQNYFAGYEGVAGAERPQILKEASQNVNPADFAALEAPYAELFKLRRAAEMTGVAEAAKDKARYDAQFAMDQRLEEADRLAQETERNQQTQNALGVPTTGRGPEGGQASASTAGVSPMAGLSATKRTREFGPQGYKSTRETISPLDQARIRSEDTARTAGTALEREKYNQTDYQNAIKNVQDANATLKGLEEQYHATGQGRDALGMARQDMAVRRRELNDVMNKLRPNAPPSGSPERPSSVTAPVAFAPSETQPDHALPEKARQELIAKNLGEKTTAANSEIDKTRLGVERVTKFLPQIKELHRLVTTQNIGHPALDSIYGAGNVLSLNRSNAQVKKLSEAIINMFAEPGQSQMMNTIVERQMQGAVVPGLFTEPQLNKINSSILMSNVEHLRNLPTFLEQWQQQHKGTLTGAADAWIDYTDHNRKYTYSTDARGLVTVKENKKVMRPEAWQSLRETGKVREVKDKTFVQQPDGSWIEN